MATEQKAQVNLIRIMGTDLNAENSLLYGLTKIKGVGFMFSNAICHVLKFDKNRKVGSLSEKEIEKLEEFLANPEKKGMPFWMLNMRKEYESGKDMHLVSKDIEYNLLQHSRRMGKLKTYKSLRKRAGVPVRGQRTKSNFRRNKTLAAMKSKSGGKR